MPFNPRGLERRPYDVAPIPVGRARAERGRVRPDAYTGGAYTGFDATYGYVTRAIRLLRTHTQNPDVAIHVAGGVADRLGREELEGFAAAVADDGRTIGVSLYDWETTPASAWRVLAPLKRSRPRLAQALARLEQVLGDHLHVREHRHEVRVAGPARDDVQMDVVGDPRAGDSAEVPAEVEAVRPVDAGERVDGVAREAVDREGLLVLGAPRTIRRGASAPPSGAPTSTGTGSGARSRPRPVDHERLLGSSLAASTQKTQPGCSSAAVDVLEPPRSPERPRHGLVLAPTRLSLRPGGPRPPTRADDAGYV